MDRLNKYSICRHIKADIGHRLVGHEGKCKDLHGHEYHFEFHCCSSDLDSVGRVIDFNVVKNVLGSWIENNLDHGMVLWEKDPLAPWFANEQLYVTAIRDYVTSPLYGQKFFLLPENPTAENIAAYVKKIANQMLEKQYGIRVFKVVVHETCNCSAIAED